MKDLMKYAEPNIVSHYLMCLALVLCALLACVVAAFLVVLVADYFAEIFGYLRLKPWQQ